MESKVPGTLLVLDDDKDVLLSARLYLEPFFERVIAIGNPADLISTVLKERVDVVLLDMNYRRGRNDGTEGLTLLKQLKKECSAEAVVMTAYEDVSVAVEAIKVGALDFIVKPWNNEKLRTTLVTAMKLRRSEKERKQLVASQQAWNQQQQNSDLIGESEAIGAIREMIKQVAPTDANVLLLGENGTGKEVVAQQLHAHSIRKNKPFVKVDLGAIPETLFESELFGAKKGAYTDLKQDKPGRFQMAEGGTLFLDEIGNLTPINQVKLLSVLQNRAVQSVGSSAPEPIDVRVITATNANLEELIEQGSFRQDLLYRIKTIEFVLPPLRDRDADSILLARHFLNRYARKYNKLTLELGSNAFKRITEYPWPGNVRELQHAIERAVILSANEQIELGDIAPQAVQNSPADAKGRTLEQVERMHIESTLSQHRGNVSQTAKALGLTRAALYRRLEKFGL